MKTINISLPIKLQDQAISLVKEGHFASFSDLVRTAIRDLLGKSQYDLWADEAKQELKKGVVRSYKTKRTISKYLSQI